MVKGFVEIGKLVTTFDTFPPFVFPSTKAKMGMRDILKNPFDKPKSRLMKRLIFV